MLEDVYLHLIINKHYQAKRMYHTTANRILHNK